MKLKLIRGYIKAFRILRWAAPVLFIVLMLTLNSMTRTPWSLAEYLGTGFAGIVIFGAFNYGIYLLGKVEQSEKEENNEENH